MSQFEAKVIADSISERGVRLVTMKLRYPRMVHSEFMTHRVFSRNASSSRAIPVSKMLQQVWHDPAMPVYWGKNQPGMQAREELSPFAKGVSKFFWRLGGKVACVFAWTLMKLGNHKQVANRVLEPWQFINVVVTATEWQNFFDLRCHPDADPTIKELADRMYFALHLSTPIQLKAGEWHLPFVHEAEVSGFKLMGKYDELPKLSVARAARTSYNNHDGSKPKVEKDIKLHDDLVMSEPMHASPAEHQAMPDTFVDGKWQYPHLHGNLRGWIQYRKLLEIQPKGVKK